MPMWSICMLYIFVQFELIRRLVINKNCLDIKFVVCFHLSVEYVPRRKRWTVLRKGTYHKRKGITERNIERKTSTKTETYGRHIPQKRTRVVNIHQFTTFHYFLIGPEWYLNIVRMFLPQVLPRKSFLNKTELSYFQVYQD